MSPSARQADLCCPLKGFRQAQAAVIRNPDQSEAPMPISHVAVPDFAAHLLKITVKLVPLADLKRRLCRWRMSPMTARW